MIDLVNFMSIIVSPRIVFKILLSGSWDFLQNQPLILYVTQITYLLCVCFL
jgi:hypothetical protein